MPDGEQAYRSRHHREFLDPAAGPRLLADDAAWVRTRLARNGVPEAAIAAHLSVIGNPPAMAAALAWYRARGTRQAIGPTKVPTLFIWGASDRLVTPAYGRAYCGMIPGARMTVVERAGHAPHVEQPDAFVANVMSFAA